MAGISKKQRLERQRQQQQKEARIKRLCRAIEHAAKSRLTEHDRRQLKKDKLLDTTNMYKTDSSNVVPTSDKIVYVPNKRSMMDPMTLQAESESTRNEIIAKSKRIAPAFNKGGYTYMGGNTEELKNTRRDR